MNREKKEYEILRSVVIALIVVAAVIFALVMVTHPDRALVDTSLSGALSAAVETMLG